MLLYGTVRSVVRRVSCRYAKLRRDCGVDAANWQKVFSYRLANVVPNTLQELTLPDGENRTSLTNCSLFHKGQQQISTYFDVAHRPVSTVECMKVKSCDGTRDSDAADGKLG